MCRWRCVALTYNATGSYSYENSWSVTVNATGETYSSDGFTWFCVTCTDENADNYNADADIVCTIYSNELVTLGCTDEAACNYDSTATLDDGTCTYAAVGFDCDGLCELLEEMQLKLLSQITECMTMILGVLLMLMACTCCCQVTNQVLLH